MGTEDALDALLRARYVRDRTRDELRSAWFVPTLFGVLFLVSVGPGLAGRLPLLIYWAVAGMLAVGGVVVYYRQRERRTGASRLVAPEVATAFGFWVAALLLAGLASSEHPLGLWWLFSLHVHWGLPVLGTVTLAPLGAPLAVIVGYLAAWVISRGRRSLAVGLLIALMLFVIEGVTLTLADGAVLISASQGVGGVSFSTLSHVGTVVASWVVPTVAFALVLLGAGWVIRSLDRSRV